MQIFSSFWYERPDQIFFYFPKKPNPKKIMLPGMITYLVTKLWVNVTQMNFSTVLPITDIFFLIIK